MAMNFWLQQSIEINDDGIFMIYTTLDIPQIVQGNAPPSIVKMQLFQENIFSKFCVLSFQNCQDFNVWFMKLAAKKPLGTNQILPQSITSGWQRTKHSSKILCLLFWIFMFSRILAKINALQKNNFSEANLRLRELIFMGSKEANGPDFLTPLTVQLLCQEWRENRGWKHNAWIQTRAASSVVF